MTRDSESFGFRALAGVARIFVPQSPILLVITILILVCLGSPTRAVAESTIACPPGTYDMLDWMTLDSNLRTTYHMEGTSNPLYTNMQSGKFYWIKGGLGLSLGRSTLRQQVRLFVDHGTVLDCSTKL